MLADLMFFSGRKLSKCGIFRVEPSAPIDLLQRAMTSCAPALITGVAGAPPSARRARESEFASRTFKADDLSQKRLGTYDNLQLNTLRFNLCPGEGSKSMKLKSQNMDILQAWYKAGRLNGRLAQEMV